jgi:hypothetical protein
MKGRGDIETKTARGGAPCAERNERNASRSCARDGRGVSVLKSDAKVVKSYGVNAPFGMGMFSAERRVKCYRRRRTVRDEGTR